MSSSQGAPLPSGTSSLMRSHLLSRSEAEAEKWQAALAAQIRRVSEENAHQGRALMVTVCKLKAQVAVLLCAAAWFCLTNVQALLDQYQGPADPSFGVFVTVLAGNELRRTGVVTVQSGVAKFSDDEDFSVNLPEGQQWRGNSSLKIVLMGSAHAPEHGNFKGAPVPRSSSLLVCHYFCAGRCFILAEGRVQLGEHFRPGPRGYLAGTSSVLCSLELPKQTSSTASAAVSFRGKLPSKAASKTTGTCHLHFVPAE
jgi:hypothetical protein